MLEAADRRDYGELIRPTQVHGSLYSSPEIFAEELARIWYTTWVFVGHESEVAHPNDYVRKKLGLQDVIMTRDRDGQVHLLLNRCAHRGNQVCEDERGNSGSFRCPYHGWTYRNTGELLGYPVQPGVRRQGHAGTAAGAGPGAAGGFLSGVRVRQLRRDRAVADRAPGGGGRGTGPAGPAVARGPGRADRGLAQAPDPGQLEAAGRERDRRLPPAVRARLDLRRHRQPDRRAVQRQVDRGDPGSGRRPQRERPAAGVPPVRAADALVRHHGRAGAGVRGRDAAVLRGRRRADHGRGRRRT